MTWPQHQLVEQKMIDDSTVYIAKRDGVVLSMVQPVLVPPSLMQQPHGPTTTTTTTHLQVQQLQIQQQVQQYQQLPSQMLSSVSSTSSSMLTNRTKRILQSKEINARHGRTVVVNSIVETRLSQRRRVNLMLMWLFLMMIHSMNLFLCEPTHRSSPTSFTTPVVEAFITTPTQQRHCRNRNNDCSRSSLYVQHNRQIVPSSTHTSVLVRPLPGRPSYKTATISSFMDRRRANHCCCHLTSKDDSDIDVTRTNQEIVTTSANIETSSVSSQQPSAAAVTGAVAAAATIIGTNYNNENNNNSNNNPPFVVTLDDASQHSYTEAIQRTILWVSAALLFGTTLWITNDVTMGEEFFAGYLVEQSLSVDNLFVFLLLFEYFQVPLQYQDRVLNWGIYGAIVMRAIMIGLGSVALQQFRGILLVFAAILVYSSVSFFLKGDNNDEDEKDDPGQNSIVQFSRSLFPSTNEFDGNRFFTLVDGVRTATPLFVCMIAVEISDVVFAVDSIPAVFGVTEVR
jgi:Integral membrane protein TerC family